MTRMKLIVKHRSKSKQETAFDKHGNILSGSIEEILTRFIAALPYVILSSAAYS